MLPSIIPRAKQVHNNVSSYVSRATKYDIFEVRFHSHSSSSPLHWMIKGNLGQENNLTKITTYQIFHRAIQDKNQPHEVPIFYCFPPYLILNTRIWLGDRMETISFRIIGCNCCILLPYSPDRVQMLLISYKTYQGISSNILDI